MKYSFLKKRKYRLKDYSIVPLRKQDIQLVRKWRNEQIDVLRQKTKLSHIDQNRYYKKLEKESFYKKNPEMILFSLLINKKCIGYGGFVHIDWENKRAEISIITMTSRNEDLKTYEKDFCAFFYLIKELAFNEIEFNRLTTETYDIRPYVIKLLEKIGFRLEGKMKEYVKINDKYVDSLIHACLKKDYIK
jgi:RimJ/RimL family protein N-acetyltransferase